jgi:hypothetical protein
MEIGGMGATLIVLWIMGSVIASLGVRSVLSSRTGGLCVGWIRHELFADATSAGIGATTVAVAALLLRDVHFRRVPARQLRGVTGAKCSYSLLGAKVENGAVRCPEYGDQFFLHQRGLVEADFRIEGDALPNEFTREAEQREKTRKSHSRRSTPK